jgi:hypothetical protein
MTTQTIAFLLLALCPAAQAQSSTVFKQALVNVPGTSFFIGSIGITVTSAAMPQVGQSGHQALFQLSNNGVSSCDTTHVTMSLELLGSFDGVNYYPIGNPSLLLSSALNTSLTQTASGIYSSIKIAVTGRTGSGFTPGNCLVNVWYSATANGLPVTPLQAQSQNTSSTGATIIEKGPRSVGNSTAGSGAAAVLQIGPCAGPCTPTYIDCLTLSLQVKTTLAATAATNATITDGGTIYWQIGVGFPSGTVAGTSWSQSFCGLNLTIPGNATYTIGYDAGLTNVQETVSASTWGVIR